MDLEKPMTTLKKSFKIHNTSTVRFIIHQRSNLYCVRRSCEIFTSHNDIWMTS